MSFFGLLVVMGLALSGSVFGVLAGVIVLLLLGTFIALLRTEKQPSKSSKASVDVEDPAGIGLGPGESEQIDQEDELELDVDED